MKHYTTLLITSAFFLRLANTTEAAALQMENAPLLSPKHKQKAITNIAPIVVETPVGTVPRLPWQVWVTYSDGSKEWRQVKWNNYMRSTEESEANADINPVGSE